jgi:hypothetical protein
MKGIIWIVKTPPINWKAIPINRLCKYTLFTKRTEIRNKLMPSTPY